MELGSAWWAGLISYLGGSLAMLVAVVLSGELWLSGAAVARSSWVSWKQFIRRDIHRHRYLDDPAARRSHRFGAYRVGSDGRRAEVRPSWSSRHTAARGHTTARPILDHALTGPF
jgi:hypothetical protein